MKEKMSLEEATMKALLGQLDTPVEQKDDVEGIIDGVLVVTDPEITPDEYEEVIDNAKEILEDTPEGEVPFNDQYVGEYLLTCPICGSSFINKDVLNVGDSCPICTEVPEQGFILNGQVATQEDVELQNDIKSEENREENDNVNIGLDNDEDIEDEPVSEEDVEEVQDELLASEVTRESDKKLEEAEELNESKNIIKRPEQLNESNESKELKLKNNSGVIENEKELRTAWEEELYQDLEDGETLDDMKKKVPFEKWIQDLLDTNDFKKVENSNYIKMSKQLNEDEQMEVKSENILKEIKDKLYWLSTHNKNYNKEQYNTILDLQDLVDKLDNNDTDRKITEIDEDKNLNKEDEWENVDLD